MASGCAKAKISATLISTVLHFNIVATFPALVVLFTLLLRKVLKLEFHDSILICFKRKMQTCKLILDTIFELLVPTPGL